MKSYRVKIEIPAESVITNAFGAGCRVQEFASGYFCSIRDSNNRLLEFFLISSEDYKTGDLVNALPLAFANYRERDDLITESSIVFVGVTHGSDINVIHLQRDIDNVFNMLGKYGIISSKGYGSGGCNILLKSYSGSDK